MPANKGVDEEDAVKIDGSPVLITKRGKKYYAVDPKTNKPISSGNVATYKTKRNFAQKTLKNVAIFDNTIVKRGVPEKEVPTIDEMKDIPPEERSNFAVVVTYTMRDKYGEKRTIHGYSSVFKSDYELKDRLKEAKGNVKMIQKSGELKNPKLKGVRIVRYSPRH